MPRKKYIIIQWNCRGVRGHLADLRAICEYYLPDIIILNETLLGLNDDLVVEFLDANGKLITYAVLCPLPKAGGRGIAILIRRDSQASVERVYEPTADVVGEWLGLHLSFDGGAELIVGTGYNRPSDRLDDSFARNLLLDRNYPCVFAGDFNAWCEEAGCAVTNPSGRVISELLEDAFLLNSPDEPTRFAEGDVPRALDLWISNRLALDLTKNSSLAVLDQHGSDHCVTMIELEIEIKTTVSADPPAPPDDPDEQRYDFSNAEQNGYGRAVTEELTAVKHLLPRKGDPKYAIDAYYNALTQAMFRAANRTLPILSVDQLPKFQISPAIEEALLARTLAERFHKKNSSQASRILFNSANRRVHQLIGEEKDRVRERKLAEIERLFKENKARLAWKLAQEFLGGKKRRRKLPTLRLQNGKIAATDQAKAQALAEHWAPTFSEAPKQSSKQSDADFWSHIDEQCDSDPELHSLELIPDQFSVVITRSAMIRCIRKLKMKAPGMDGVLNPLIKHGGAFLRSCLRWLYNCSLNTGHFPSAWKVAVIVPTPKEGKSRSSLDGHRPISLLSSISKLMETIIASFLSDFCENNNIFPKHQAGFRRKRNTYDAIIRLAHDIHESWRGEDDEYLPCVAAFLDMKAAFDTVWLNGLRTILKGLGLPPAVTRWISDFLRNRKFLVKVENATSSIFNINCGVPQGSPLSPILFIIFTSTMFQSEVSPDDARKSTAVATFADDIGLWAVGHPAVLAGARIQAKLREVEIWADRWRLQLNPQKCEYMVFGRHGTLNVVLSINGVPLKQAKSFKYLGLNLAPYMGWATHFEVSCSKAAGRIAALRRMCYGGQLSLKTGLMFYKAIVRPVVEYGAPCFGQLSTTLAEKLHTLENRAIKAILGLSKRTASATVEALRTDKFPNLDLISNRFNEMTLNYFNNALYFSEEIGNLVRLARDNPNETSRSPVRHYLDLLGPGPLPCMASEPIAYVGALTDSDDEGEEHL